MDWNKILNWKLLSGSHKFPGPDGGTCINEAAIVAAGFEYNSVAYAEDCPPCFSRVLSAYAIRLNDTLPDDLRQELLLPFVTRLAGTADTQEIERQRFDYLMLGLVRILAIPLRGFDDDLARKCEAVANYDQALAVVNKIVLARTRARAHARARARDDLARDLDRARAHARAHARALALALALARALALALDLARDDRARAHEIYKAQVALLNSAMQIGKQAKPIDAALVEQRMDRARACALQS